MISISRASCNTLLPFFDGARVGIIALVDEATAYQHARERDALAKILEGFIDVPHVAGG